MRGARIDDLRRPLPEPPHPLAPPAAETAVEEIPLRLEHGGELARLEFAWESWGRDVDGTICVVPSFSSDCHARSSAADLRPGWWERMIGPGRALDTDRFRIVAASILGGCGGTTGPPSVDPDTGEPYRGAFPTISVRDMARAQLRWLDRIGVEEVVAVVGGSLGAMQVMEMAVLRPRLARRIVTISGTDRTRPFTAAVHHIGRRMIMADPAWRHGDYVDDGPLAGLKVARELGTLFYRAPEEFNARFPWPPVNPPSLTGVTFEVQSYLDHQGTKILGQFDPNSYLTLSLAMDLHDLGRGRGSVVEAVAPVEGTFLTVGVEQDRLIPIDEQEGFHRILEEAGRTAHYRRLSSPIGHDAFLVESDTFDAVLQRFFDETGA